MKTYPISALALASAVLFSANGWSGECQIAKVAELPVDTTVGRPAIKGKLNGMDMLILVDTGSFASALTHSAAVRAGLSPTIVDGLKVIGVGGESQVKSVTVQELLVGDFSIRDRRWYVFGESKSDDGDLGMIIGRDLLANFDVELDLGAGKMLWWKPKDCEKSPLAYWNKDFMLAELEPSREDAIETYVVLNGKRVLAMIDTGAGTTVVDTDTAKRAGFREDAPNVTEAGYAAGLGGSKTLEVHTAIFDSFEMGDLTVKNARIQVVDLNRNTRDAETGSHIKQETDLLPEMLIGRDFLMANRVLVANSQHYIYFTYNGGQIFKTSEPEQDEPNNEPSGASNSDTEEKPAQ